MARSLDDVLGDLETVELTAVNFEDADQDYEDRYERRKELEAEALELARGAVDLAIQRLVESQGLPDEAGFLERRPMLCRVLAGLDAPEARRKVGAALATLPAQDVGSIVTAAAELPGTATVLAGWLTGLRAAPEAQRVAFVEAYVAQPRPAGDPVLAQAKSDPSPSVQRLVPR